MLDMAKCRFSALKSGACSSYPHVPMLHASITMVGGRREERQEASQAKAFEAARQAKALVKTWKKPRLSPGQSYLPVELWGMVLEQLLTEDSLWDLRATVQQLCSASMICKDLCLAVQQQGWPHLCRLLSALRPPISTERGTKLRGEKGQLPDNPDLLVTDPASLRMPELKAACQYYGLSSSGEVTAARAASAVRKSRYATCGAIRIKDSACRTQSTNLQASGHVQAQRLRPWPGSWASSV